MIDVELNQPLQVNTEGTAGPYLMVPLTQLPDVRAVLDANQLRYTVSQDAISLDERPVIAIVDFGIGADVAQIQAILDAA